MRGKSLLAGVVAAASLLTLSLPAAAFTLTVAKITVSGGGGGGGGNEYGFSFANHQNHYCMDAYNGHGPLVWSYPCNNTAAQTWFVEQDASSGWYVLRNLATHQCLRVMPYSGDGNGQQAVLDTCDPGAGGNLWKFYNVYDSSGYAYLAVVNLSSWDCLDAGNGPYQSLKQWQCINGDYWQYWYTNDQYYGPA